MRWAVLAATLLLASHAAAQVVPRSNPADPHIQTVRWYKGQDYLLTASENDGLLVWIEPGEAIESIEASDPNAVDVVAERGAGSFTIKPRAGSAGTAMTVRTDRRIYNLFVRPAFGSDAPLSVRFLFEESQQASGSTNVSDQLYRPRTGYRWSYKLRGDRDVSPATLWDDGAKTYIGYAENQPLPAVFARNAVGDEEVVNGYMRGDFFVIDRIYRELVFRIDRDSARATRIAKADGSDG